MSGTLLKASAWHLVFWLLLGGVIFTVDAHTARSVVYGAITAILPAALMLLAVVGKKNKAGPKEYTRAVYRGELHKFLLTIVLFALVFTQGGTVNAGVLFAVFLVAMAIQWAITARQILQE